MSGEDANPLNRRLPAEVITRRKREDKKVIEPVDNTVQVDLKTALGCKPEARLRWLTKALKMVEEKRTTSTELYDIISNRKFCATMQSKNSQKLRGIISENLSLFSDKQQRFLRSEDWAPNKQFEEEDAPASSRAEPEERRVTSEKKPDEKKPKEKDAKSAETTESGPGGWTWTVRDRPLTDASSSKAKKASAEKSEALFEAMAEKNQAARKQQEDAVDDSLALLERLNQQKVEEPPPEKAKDRDRKKRKASRSKSSVSAASASTSSRTRRKKKKKGGRSRSRDGGRGGGKDQGGRNFEDALKRRLQQRERELETSRMPVVDPGHARKSWR